MSARSSTIPIKRLDFRHKKEPFKHEYSGKLSGQIKPKPILTGFKTSNLLKYQNLQKHTPYVTQKHFNPIQKIKF